MHLTTLCWWQFQWWSWTVVTTQPWRWTCTDAPSSHGESTTRSNFLSARGECHKVKAFGMEKKINKKVWHWQGEEEWQQFLLLQVCVWWQETHPGWYSVRVSHLRSLKHTPAPWVRTHRSLAGSIAQFFSRMSSWGLQEIPTQKNFPITSFP